MVRCGSEPASRPSTAQLAYAVPTRPAASSGSSQPWATRSPRNWSTSAWRPSTGSTQWPAVAIWPVSETKNPVQMEATVSSSLQVEPSSVGKAT